jgi:hypothetical protein
MGMSRPHFSIRSIMVVVAAAAAICWVNREVPVLAILGTAGLLLGVLLFSLGDRSLQFANAANGTKLAGGVIAGVLSLAAGVVGALSLGAGLLLLIMCFLRTLGEFMRFE